VEEIIPPSNPADPTRIAMILPLFYLIVKELAG
jgi:hypothetical protein